MFQVTGIAKKHRSHSSSVSQGVTTQCGATPASVGEEDEGEVCTCCLHAAHANVVDANRTLVHNPQRQDACPQNGAPHPPSAEFFPVFKRTVTVP